LRDFVSGALAGFKAPTRIALTGVSLPRTPSGKIVKRGIVERLGLADLLEPV
jgi:acyl-CoA synthetase (AMP-forming)/AMP-acid ligase II